MTPPDGAARAETRLSALSLRVLNALEDGEWHDYEEVVEAVQYSIAPGEAYRAGREKSRAEIDTREMDEVIASGRRSQTIGIINNLIANKRIERNVNTRSNEGKMLRILERVPLVYVIRDENDEIHVYPWWAEGQIAVNVLDLKAKTTDPKAEAAAVKKIFDSLPKRMAGKETVQRACRILMNRHNVAAALQDLLGDFPEEGSEPDDTPDAVVGLPDHQLNDHLTTTDPDTNYPPGESSPTSPAMGEMTYE